MAAVDSCAGSRVCYYFEKKVTAACSSASCGSLHIKLGAGAAASNQIGMDGGFPLLRMALNDMALNFVTI